MPALFLLLLAAAPPPVDFDTEVLPVLTKAGCNAGACHGAAAGRGGFSLSLFGGDPTADHRAITLELEGRRVNLARPERSLLLLKPTWQLDHEGGQRFEEDSHQARVLLDWIRGGAVRAPTRKLVRLEVAPAAATVERLPAELSLEVTAHFDDGTTRAAGDLAVYTPADPASTEIDERGRVTVLRPGRHAIVVRLMTEVAAVQVTAAWPHAPLDLAAAPRGNWIDDEIYETLADLRLEPAPRAGDATLLRRVTLDLTGRLPTPDRVRAYLADGDERKYEAEVERLIASPAFTEYWTYKLARWLRVRRGPSDDEGTRALHAWLKGQVAANRPLDELARELLVAEGDSHEYGPANFHRNAADARSQAEYVAESLLGIRLRCANCHNHPLDRWTQDDYHGLAAIFARLERGRVVALKPDGKVDHPATGQPAMPRIPGERLLPPEGDQRGALADWLTSPDHARFATAQVNRLWQSLMGRGLVDPIDDLRDTNPASHPALLRRLADDFIEHGHDLRHTLRLIALSAAYQRSSRAMKGSGVFGGKNISNVDDSNVDDSAPPKTPDPLAMHDDRFYSHALVRPLPAEVLLDAVSDATGVASEFHDRSVIGRSPPSAPSLGTRAVGVYEPRIAAVELGPLASCTFERGCADDAGQAASLDDLAAQLHWLNGPIVNDRVRNPAGAVGKLAHSNLPADRLIDELYLRILSRPATARERVFWQTELSRGDRSERALDLAWALLSCREFATNH
jgi:hypothetical protein